MRATTLARKVRRGLVGSPKALAKYRIPPIDPRSIEGARLQREGREHYLRDLAPLTIERFAAVRVREQRDLDKDPIEAYIDTSTLHPTADGARALANKEDERNRMAIRRGTALAHVRIARLRIEEVRG